MSTRDAQLTLTITSCAPDDAPTLATRLLDSQLVACVSVVPGVQSHYRWQGEVQRDQESLLLIKTPSDRVDAMTETLLSVHPYDTPEVVTFEADQVSKGYLAWALSVTPADQS